MTLVELLVVFAIASILAGVGATSFFTVRHQARVGVVDDALRSMEALAVASAGGRAPFGFMDEVAKSPPAGVPADASVTVVADEGRFVVSSEAQRVCRTLYLHADGRDGFIRNVDCETGQVEDAPTAEQVPALVHPAPATPGGVHAEVDGSAVTVRWSYTPAGGQDPAPSFRVMRRGASSTSEQFEVAGTTAASSLRLTGLEPGRPYEFVVVAFDGRADSAPSTVVAATPGDAAPGVAAGLQATGGANQVSLRWTPARGAVTGQVLHRAAGTCQPPSGCSAPTRTELAASTSSWTDSSVSPGGTYTYWVTSQAGTRESAPSTPAHVTAATSEPATRPSDLRWTAAATSVTLTWAPPQGAAASSYVVARDGAAIATLPSTTTTYTDVGLVQGATYRYTVRSVDERGRRSQPAGPVVAGPATAGPPSAPSNVTAVLRADGKAVVSWDGPSGTGYHYEVYDGATYLATVSRTTRWVDHTPRQSVVYSVRAVRDHQRSPWAASPPLAP